MNKQILNAIKNLEQRTVDLYYKVKGAIGPMGPQGPTGAQGIQGSTGAVGPAGVTGLTWRGTWSAGTAYLANDAVGYNGASYFRLISGTTAGLPNVDTTNWALLASQGAVGPQGAQGPTGAQGVAGTVPVKTTGQVYAGAYPGTNLNYDINFVINTGELQLVKLPTTSVIGKEVIIYANNNNFDFRISTEGPFLSLVGIDQYLSTVTVKPNTNYSCIYRGLGYWKVSAIGPNLQQVLNVGDTITNGFNILKINEDSFEITDPTNASGLQSTGLNLKRNLMATTVLQAAATVTAPRTITLPDASGTVALSPPLTSYIDETAAAAGGVLVGNLYHTAGVVKIRLI